MQATQSPASNDPHDVLEIAPDIVLVARAEEELSKLARDAKARAPELPPQPKPGPRLVEDSSVPSIDTGFRATAVNRGRPSRGGRAIRGFFGVLLAVLVGGAVLTLKVSGDVAQQVITSWIPAFAARSEPSDNPAPQEQSAAAAQPAATAAAALPPVQPADATTQNGVASAAPETAAAPDQAQMLQSMAHHLANLRQEVDSLRGQLAELRASQEQMSRDMEKAAEQKDRMKLSALPARPAAPPPPPRRATSTFRPSQAAVAPMNPPPAAYVPPPPQTAQPYTPPQAAPQTAYDPNAPRPPLPVRE
jgi:chemotaxis protein histidine kinase CheA